MSIFQSRCHTLAAVADRAAKLFIGVFGYCRMSCKRLRRIFESWVFKTQVAGFATVCDAKFLAPSLPISKSKFSGLGCAGGFLIEERLEFSLIFKVGTVVIFPHHPYE